MGRGTEDKTRSIRGEDRILRLQDVIGQWNDEAFTAGQNALDVQRDPRPGIAVVSPDEVTQTEDIVGDPDHERVGPACLGKVQIRCVGEGPGLRIDGDGAVLWTLDDLVEDAIAFGVHRADLTGDHPVGALHGGGIIAELRRLIEERPAHPLQKCCHEGRFGRRAGGPGVQQRAIHGRGHGNQPRLPGTRLDLGRPDRGGILVVHALHGVLHGHRCHGDGRQSADFGRGLPWRRGNATVGEFRGALHELRFAIRTVGAGGVVVDVRRTGRTVGLVGIAVVGVDVVGVVAVVGVLGVVAVGVVAVGVLDAGVVGVGVLAVAGVVAVGVVGLRGCGRAASSRFRRRRAGRGVGVGIQRVGIRQTASRPEREHSGRRQRHRPVLAGMCRPVHPGRQAGLGVGDGIGGTGFRTFEHEKTSR